MTLPIAPNQYQRLEETENRRQINQRLNLIENRPIALPETGQPHLNIVPQDTEYSFTDTDGTYLERIRRYSTSGGTLRASIRAGTQPSQPWDLGLGNRRDWLVFNLPFIPFGRRASASLVIPARTSSRVDTRSASGTPIYRGSFTIPEVIIPYSDLVIDRRLHTEFPTFDWPSNVPQRARNNFELRMIYQYTSTTTFRLEIELRRRPGSSINPNLGFALPYPSGNSLYWDYVDTKSGTGPTFFERFVDIGYDTDSMVPGLYNMVLKKDGVSIASELIDRDILKALPDVIEGVTPSTVNAYPVFVDEYGIGSWYIGKNGTNILMALEDWGTSTLTEPQFHVDLIQVQTS